MGCSAVADRDHEHRRRSQNRDRREPWRSVKPSAQPTLVRTQHLPHPGKTARWLRKRGPAGRFLLVTPCISACHCGSMYGSVHVHMVYSVRAKLAVRITARFADLCPFCPVSRAPLTGAAHPGWPVLRVLLAPGGGLALFVPAAGAARLPDRPAPSHRGSTEGTGCASPPLGWKTSTTPWRAALCPELDTAASRGVMHQGFPVSPVRDWIRRSRSCTCRGLVMDLSCTCRIPAPVTRRITRLRCPLVAAVSKAPGRLVDVDLAKESGGVP